MAVNNLLEQNKIVLELTSDSFKVVEVGLSGNNPELIRYALLPIPSGGIIADWLRSVWSQKKFSHNRVISLIPGHLVKYRTVTLPNLASEELAGAIQLELEGQNYQDYNWQIIGNSSQEQFCQVKLALVKKDDLAEQFNVLSQAGLELQWSGLCSDGIINFINFNHHFFDDLNKTQAYLNFSQNETEFGLINDKELLYFRKFAVTQIDLLGEHQKTVLEEFGEDLRLSLAAASGNGHDTLQVNVWFFGKPDSLPTQISPILKNLGLNLQVPNKSGLAGVLIEGLTPELAPLLGIALEAAGYIGRNGRRFLSVQQQARQGLLRRVTLGFQAGVLIVLLIMGLVLFIRSDLAKREKIQEWLAGKSEVLTELRNIDRMTRQKLTEIRVLDSWLGSRGRELEFLAALQNKLPPGTVITDLTIDNGTVKDLSGVTSSVSLLLAALNRDPVLGTLKLKGTVSVTGSGELFHLEGSLPGKEFQ